MIRMEVHVRWNQLVAAICDYAHQHLQPGVATDGDIARLAVMLEKAKKSAHFDPVKGGGHEGR